VHSFVSQFGSVSLISLVKSILIMSDGASGSDIISSGIVSVISDVNGFNPGRKLPGSFIEFVGDNITFSGVDTVGNSAGIAGIIAGIAGFRADIAGIGVGI